MVRFLNLFEVMLFLLHVNLLIKCLLRFWIIKYLISFYFLLNLFIPYLSRFLGLHVLCTILVLVLINYLLDHKKSTSVFILLLTTILFLHMSPSMSLLFPLKVLLIPLGLHLIHAIFLVLSIFL